jgi:hypothetical protein
MILISIIQWSYFLHWREFLKPPNYFQWSLVIINSHFIIVSQYVFVNDLIPCIIIEPPYLSLLCFPFKIVIHYVTFHLIQINQPFLINLVQVVCIKCIYWPFAFFIITVHDIICVKLRNVRSISHTLHSECHFVYFRKCINVIYHISSFLKHSSPLNHAFHQGRILIVVLDFCFFLLRLPHFTLKFLYFI